jgi:hypothetical protein
MNDYDSNYPFQDIVNGDGLMLSMQSGPFKSKNSGKNDSLTKQNRLDEMTNLYKEVLDAIEEEGNDNSLWAKPAAPVEVDSVGMKALQASGRMSDGQVSIIRSLLDALEEKGIGTSDLASTDAIDDADNNFKNNFPELGREWTNGKKVVIELTDEQPGSPVSHEVLEQFVLVNPSADHIFERLTTWSGPERNNEFANQVINCITYEDLCELIAVDVDPESDAGIFLVELLESYKTLMDQVVWKYPEGSKFPMPEEFHKLKKTYYDSTLTSCSKEFLENVAFEFTGDEDAAGVDRIARQVFASLQKIFKRAAGRS